MTTQEIEEIKQSYVSKDFILTNFGREAFKNYPSEKIGLSISTINRFKSKLETFEKGSDELISFIKTIIDCEFDTKDIFLILDKKIFSEEIKSALNKIK